MKGRVGMEKFLTPGAILLVGMLALVAFRYEVQPFGPDQKFVLVRDRWTGSAKWCGGPEGSVRCFRLLSDGYSLASR